MSHDVHSWRLNHSVSLHVWPTKHNLLNCWIWSLLIQGFVFYVAKLTLMSITWRWHLWKLDSETDVLPGWNVVIIHGIWNLESSSTLVRTHERNFSLHIPCSFWTALGWVEVTLRLCGILIQYFNLMESENLARAWHFPICLLNEIGLQTFWLPPYCPKSSLYSIKKPRT
jgi:hypothetical protein